MATLKNILDRFEETRSDFDRSATRQLEKLLAQLSRRKFKNAADLGRYHETLLFLRAYPRNAKVLKIAEQQLTAFPERVALLEKLNVDLGDINVPDMSGIAGTSVTDTFTFDIVSWLVSRYPNQLEFDWEWFEDENRLAESWPRFMPLLEEDAFVEANVPYADWLRQARGRKRAVSWLIERFAGLHKPALERAELYNSQKLYVTWTFPFSASRTGQRVSGPRVHYHRDPLIQRRDVSLRNEIKKAQPPTKQLSKRHGERALDLARESSTVRYRELYGFTYGDPKRVLRVNLGRGVELLVMTLPPERRLPLRAYHAAMIFKNGVAVGYFEGLSLADRMESGFNFYYTFREGETAWIYARTLNVFHHLLGVTTFSIDPYQVGFENEEGIESGAFWFYRKLGFRPTLRSVMRLTEKEEKKLRNRKNYRTSPQMLRKLAASPMVFELDDSTRGDWDNFQVRTIGLALQRLLAEKFAGDATKLREAAKRYAEKQLGLSLTKWTAPRNRALSDFAALVMLIKDLPRWSPTEKRAVAKIMLAKSLGDETRYLQLMKEHSRFRSALIRLGRTKR